MLYPKRRNGSEAIAWPPFPPEPMDAPSPAPFTLGPAPTLQAEKTPSFSSFLARGSPRTCAFLWLARCC